MARLASNEKMGYYPTPKKSLQYIKLMITLGGDHYYGEYHAIDPCCGTGDALREVAFGIHTYGIELDVERADTASSRLGKVLQGSIFDAQIKPLGCFGLLYLNPPYDSEDGERVEMKFLRHSTKWLAPKGVLVFIVPEHIFERQDYREWIGQHFTDICIYRLHRDDFPTFKQVVMYGVKRPSRSEIVEVIPPPPYPHIEDFVPIWGTEEARGFQGRYVIPETSGPSEVSIKEAVTEEEIARHKTILIEELEKIRGKGEGIVSLSPLLPLRRGHLVTLLTAGALDGRIDTPEGYLLVKGFSERVKYTREEDDKEITTDTYAVCVRVIEASGANARWYDIR